MHAGTEEKKAVSLSVVALPGDESWVGAGVRCGDKGCSTQAPTSHLCLKRCGISPDVGEAGCRWSEPGHLGLSFARREQSSRTAAAFGMGSARVLSPNTSPSRETPIASEFPEALWVPLRVSLCNVPPRYCQVVRNGKVRRLGDGGFQPELWLSREGERVTKFKQNQK